MEKETVRTRVMLASGDQMPARGAVSWGAERYSQGGNVPRQNPWTPSVRYVWRTQSVKELNL